MYDGQRGLSLTSVYGSGGVTPVWTWLGRCAFGWTQRERDLARRGVGLSLSGLFRYRSLSLYTAKTTYISHLRAVCNTVC